MAERFLLQRETLDIELEGRSFRLEEMSGADLRRYLEMLSSPVQTALKDLTEKGEAHITEALGALQEAENELLAWLLRHPADGGVPADGEFLAALSYKQRRGIIEAQDRLNDTEALVGNGYRLLAMAQARRAVTGSAGLS